MPVVHLKDFEVTPAVVHIRRGGHVRWSWEDAYTSHTVTSRGRDRFRSSGARGEGSTYTVTFERRGTYRFACRIHPSMKGRVVVGLTTKHRRPTP
jgi:plastocyanin